MLGKGIVDLSRDGCYLSSRRVIPSLPLCILQICNCFARIYICSICLWLAYGRIDPKNACKVEVNVNSYFSTRDGKRVYNRGRTISWIVDSEQYAVIDLENDIFREGYFWDSNQRANFWVVTGPHLTCKLTSDGQLLNLLRASQLVKFLMIVGGIEKDNEMPAAVNMVGEDTHAAMNVVEDMKIRGFEWAAVPQYGETTAGPPMVEEEEKEHFMTVGCDPHGDEPTGVDEEWRYFNNVDSAIHDAQPVENIEVEV